MKEIDGMAHRIRRNFGKIGKTIEIPNLIEVQKQSYDRLLQKEIVAEEREDQGLQSPFKSVFPIQDFSGTSSLEFVKYTFEEPKYDEDTCLERDITFSAPLYVRVALINREAGDEVSAKLFENLVQNGSNFKAIFISIGGVIERFFIG